ncbi:MAG: sugar kinase [Deltaproteobacteria bacterium]|nr:sugar kinase [Deltaproteobacteria bacterium]MBW2052526.1 sugar kinase [Deltaproteobacteria bacterium]MBW2140399.1 sugar kinase [Deltaproteobacteria bacterium]MBW2324471.1 sugar kinase [Deltaproteobacteria bacterium]
MLAVVGTVPDANFPFVSGQVELDDGEIVICGQRLTINRGTPALLAAAIKTSLAIGGPPIFAYLAGDIGLGTGSRKLYEYLSENLALTSFQAITFHYLLPDVDWHNRVLFALEEMKQRPVLIADAGYMYAAKMSGQAGFYDFFTPDLGELAFLADEEAPHPFYTRGFILHEENCAAEMIARAYEHDNAARYLLVKGQEDHLANDQDVIATINHPTNEAMEAIGGTGDTLTGILSALINAQNDPEASAVTAAKVNRMAGHLSNPNPSTQVLDIIEHIPTALREH